MTDWTTLEMAKKHVGIPADDYANDDLLRLKLGEAEALVLEYLNLGGSPVPEPPGEDATPQERRQAKIFIGAMYLQFAELWRYRGDDEDGTLPQSAIRGALSPQVERMLLQYRRPSLA